MKPILNPIGSPIDTKAPDYVANRKRMDELDSILRQKRAAIREGWGASYQERVKTKGKMTTWQRVEALADSPQSIFPILTFVNEGETFDDGKTSPSAGVITAFVLVEKRWTIVIANDNTVASGSWWPKTPEKIIRAQEIALKLKLPVIYLVDCSGLFLPQQGRSFPGKTGAGHIFKMNSLLSAAGVPQVAGVMGDCIAGGGYMPIISDVVFMTEQAYMVIAGAAVIQGAKSQKLSSVDIGGANVHVHLSNCADARVPDDESCLLRIREAVARMASSAVDFYRNGIAGTPPHLPTQELGGLLPAQASTPYDVRQIIGRLVDDSLFWEVLPHLGQEAVVGIARISGLYVGIVANLQALFPHPQDPSTKRAGGILYREGVAKIATFSRACNDDGIPLIWLQDVSGFDVGVEAEKQGLLGYGSSLIYTNSTNSTPMITVLLRKASGAGYYAMAGMPYDPVLQISTPISRLAVMDGRTLAMGAFHSKREESAKIKSEMALVAERIERDMDPYKAAAQMDTDEIVELSCLRDYLACVTEASYQAQGIRRIKNPRIWSLHDLDVLSQAAPQMLLSQLPVTQQSESSVGVGEQVFCSPMDGLYYGRPSPNDPPFLVEGLRLKPGQQVGLIEVMKCFYPLYYDGLIEVVVDKILVFDGRAVSAKKPLFSFTEDP